MAALTGLVVGADAALGGLLDPAVRIVTLTVTEKGYAAMRRPEHWTRMMQRSGTISPSRSARHVPGLWPPHCARRDAGVPPFTVLSCDNLPSNGDATRRVVLRFAELLDPALGRFIADNVAFPNCMVDRIVPATTADDRARIDAALGVRRMPGRWCASRSPNG